MTKKLTISLAARLVRRYLNLDDSFAGVTVSVKGDLLVIDNLNYTTAIDIVNKCVPEFTFAHVSLSTVQMVNKESQYKAWVELGRYSSIPDAHNPAFAMQAIHDVLLVKMASGEIDAQWLAKKELANRGLDKDGNWVGFAKAEAIHFS